MPNMKLYWIFYGFINIIIFIFFVCFYWSARPGETYINDLSTTEDFKIIDALYTEEHETARRNLDNAIWDIYFYLLDQIQLNKNSPEFQKFSKPALDHVISLLGQSLKFGSAVNYNNEWRRLELQNMSKIIINRLHKLQNPKSCRRAKVLICGMSFDCDIGCVLHRLAYCLKLAFVSERTMILSKKNQEWLYSNQNFTSVFKSISNCTYDDAVQFEGFTVKLSDVKLDRRVAIIHENISNSLTKQMRVLLPKQFARNLTIYHSTPAAFFHAHFTWYALQQIDLFKDIYDTFVSRFGYTNPIVGMYIPHSNESDFGTINNHSLDDYFKWAELWFQIEERKKAEYCKKMCIPSKLKRRVYIATSNLSVIEEAKEKYPNYQINSNNKINDSQHKSQFSNETLNTFIYDVQILSKSNFVVCTDNTNACRVIYELMQIEQGDAEKQIRLMDTTIAYKNTGLSKFIKNLDGTKFNKMDHFHKRELEINKHILPSYKAKENWEIVDLLVLNK